MRVIGIFETSGIEAVVLIVVELVRLLQPRFPIKHQSHLNFKISQIAPLRLQPQPQLQQLALKPPQQRLFSSS